MTARSIILARYRIVCTEQQPASQPPTHAHILAVGTGNNPAQAEQRWTLARVLSAMDRGDTFYTQGTSSGKIAEVEPYGCRWCNQRRIRSKADAVYDNNLDSLRRCSFR